MEYLRILGLIRSVTGRREADRFPAVDAPFASFERSGEGGRALMVFDAEISRRLLESPRYAQFDFLERILSIAPPERTGWIRRFCDIGLIMIDGPEHERRRLAIKAILDRCTRRLSALPRSALERVVADAFVAQPVPSAEMVSRRIITLLFSESLAEVCGRPVLLPTDAIFKIDFFNPFPTLSTLAECNAAIDACCSAIALEACGIAEQASALSLLLMGVSPLHAIVTTMINACVTSLAESGTPHAVLEALRPIDGYTVVPTNFVMRRCLAEDMVGDQTVQPGDIVYLFLGSATGCPFTRPATVAFGSGRHFCSGAKLTAAMVASVRDALLSTAVRLANATVAEPQRGKATAFLVYQTSESSVSSISRRSS